MLLKPFLGWLWCLIHMAISLFDLWSYLSNKLECYLISSKLLSKYQILHLERLKCLGVVLDSSEAKNVKEIEQLLQWFSTAGIKYVVLYDMEGVIKESIAGIEASSEEETSNLSDVCANTKSPHSRHGGMVIECLSGSDGKEAIAKAANLLYSGSCKCCNSSTTYTRGYDKMDTVFTEAHMASALRAVGSRGPEPDLLLVYGPVRCHLGFPAWRLQYTEIMHMGPLKSMRYSSIVKVLCQFAQKHQNYGKFGKLSTIVFSMYLTVDTNVKEDPFVVYKDMLLDQNLPRITRIDPVILSWRPSTLRCLFVASMGNGFWFHWDGKLADLQFGGENICTWGLYFTAAN